jgi:hypothetical protein
VRFYAIRSPKAPCEDCGGAVESFYRAPVCTQCRHQRHLARKAALARKGRETA